MARRIILGLLLVLCVLSAVFVAFAWRTAIAPVEPPARSTFDTALIARGASLAAIGDCVSCHTAPEGKPYAGGFPLHTQFGTIYGTNITPDAETGIGRWTLPAFRRAMHEGVDREGRHLYPAFPYDHFTNVSDDDLQALYAFLMTREPVRAETPPNDLTFPLNFRMLIAGWKLLYLESTGFRPDPAQSGDWNRGAYLVRGLGHCGACHTPRNALGAEKLDLDLGGGEAEGWHAPALNAATTAPIPWTADALLRYLRRGADETHDTAIGPMAAVVNNLSAVPESEVRSIATYIASVMGPADEQRQKRASQIVAKARGANEASGSVSEVQRQDAKKSDLAPQSNGAAIYAGSCAVCHVALERPAGSASGNALHLGLSTTLSLPTPVNLIRVILQGIAPADGERGPIMPGYAGAFTDAQVGALVSYLRATYTDRPEWTDVDRQVRKARQSFAEAPE
ncbi:MAG: putative alcohol dehydrogenase cytochrome c subunit protein [Betaproteobacteria bacterium]|nr:putative alcohol dehydrogenase cytochrome c subunit protein [Betaproteobacteria bacterium]